MNKPQKKLISIGYIASLLFLCFFAALGALLLHLLCTPKIGAGPDAAFYLSAAISFIQTKSVLALSSSGSLEPLTHFPPLYPIVLGTIAKLGTDVLSTTAALHYFLLFLLSLGSGVLVWQLSKSLIAGGFAAFSIAISADLLQLYALVLSESLFLPLLVLALFCLSRYLNEDSLTWLILTAVLVSLCTLCRYAGLSLLPLCLCCILAWGPKPFGKKCLSSAFCLLLGSSGMLFWYYRNWSLGLSATNREAALHFPTIDTVAVGLSTISQWILPPQIPPHLRATATLVFLPVFIACAALLLKRQRRVELNLRDAFLRVSLSFFSLYLLFLFASLCLFDAHTHLDRRILAPAYLSALLFCFCWSSFFKRKVILLSCFFLFALNQAQQSYTLIRQVQSYGGLQYSSQSWRESELIKQVQTLTAEATVVSNANDAIYLLTGELTPLLPRRADPNSRIPRAEYQKELEEVKAQLRLPNTYLVQFNRVNWRWYLPSISELAEELKLQTVFENEEGKIYHAPLL